MNEREFPLCETWARELLHPFRHRLVTAADVSDHDRLLAELEQAIYEALVEACQRGTPLAFD